MVSLFIINCFYISWENCDGLYGSIGNDRLPIDWFGLDKYDAQQKYMIWNVIILPNAKEDLNYSPVPKILYSVMHSTYLL